ncbi:hypothetical protein [uncultured Nostoc sp.]|uniref:hypothetical protein n=1 Tax=uncultured Nostoc sp. TaxID=340711 RepID=UPI0035CB3ACC
MLQKLLIEGAVRHKVVKQILGDRRTISEARKVNQWLTENADLLPSYDDLSYVEQAIAAYQKEVTADSKHNLT